MKNVSAIQPRFLSPALVLDRAQEQADDFEQVVILAIPKDKTDAQVIVFMSGELDVLPKIAMIVQDMALDFVRGDLTE